MLHQTLSKGWCHARSGLLLGLIVRARGRLVEARALFGAAQSRPALLTDPELITLAILAQWPRFRSERDFWRFAQAHLRPYFPKLCSQSQLNRRVRSVEPDLRDFQRAVARTLCGVSEVYHILDTTLIPAIVRVRASRKGLFAGQATFGRSASKTEWVYGFKVALSVSPEGVICAFGLGEAASDERPIGEFLIMEDSQEAYLADKGFTGVQWERRWLDLYGALVAATPKDNSKRAWEKTDRRWASGKRQINRRGHRPTQGPLRPGAPQGQDAGWSFGPLGGQDGGLHLRAAAQRAARATAAAPGRPFGLSDYASLVLGWPESSSSPHSLWRCPHYRAGRSLHTTDQLGR